MRGMGNFGPTPGPWHYDSGSVYAQGERDDDKPGPRPIARMDREPGNGTFGAERDANARLIAAAPDLLNVVREVDEWIDDARMVSDEFRAAEDDDLRAIVGRLRAAIAKARGE